MSKKRIFEVLARFDGMDNIEMIKEQFNIEYNNMSKR